MASGYTGAAPRGQARDSLLLTGKLTLEGDPQVREVRVRNLSEGGMMVEVDRAVEPGHALTLEMRGVGTVEGRVAWYTDGRIGVALDRPIDPRRARKPVGGGTGTPVYAKPVLTIGRPKG